jgi:hypothetical protein
MITTKSFTIFGVAATIALLSRPIDADQNLNCDAYATKAVAQQNENLALHCGFEGGAWSADFNGHRAWCRLPGVEMVNLTNEDRARDTGLRICKRKIATCSDYATLAVTQNQKNRLWGCGFAGGRWSDNADGHRNWCITADVSQTNSESQGRQTALLKCSVRQAGDDARLANIDLQNMQQKQQQLQQMMSNISKAMHEAAMSTIRNVK